MKRSSCCAPESINLNRAIITVHTCGKTTRQPIFDLWGSRPAPGWWRETRQHRQRPSWTAGMGNSIRRGISRQAAGESEPSRSWDHRWRVNEVVSATASRLIWRPASPSRAGAGTADEASAGWSQLRAVGSSGGRHQSISGRLQLEPYLSQAGKRRPGGSLRHDRRLSSIDPYF